MSNSECRWEYQSMDKMRAVCIKEHSSQNDGFHAVACFDHGTVYPIVVRNPFEAKQERELEWYFEEHLEFPFTQKVRAGDAASSVATYGESLFKQVFKDNVDVYAEYKSLLKAGLEQVQIEIAGSPNFHVLHWEALKDPELPKPLALMATVVRKNRVPSVMQILENSSPTINLLIVTARPYGKQDISYRTISRPLVEALHRTNLPVQIDILRPGTYRALRDHLGEITSKYGKGYYQIVHFDTHGVVFNNKAFLFLEGDQDNRIASVKAAELAKLLRSHQVPIAILNACQSGKQIGDKETSLGSHLMQAGVQLVLAMGYSITVSAAVLFMQTLYRHLSAGDDLAITIRNARIELYNDKKRRAHFNQLIDLEDWLLPVVYENKTPLLQLRKFNPEESKIYYDREAELASMAPYEPIYGFVGRDLDILRIERSLLLKRNMLLVRGMGGAGKTTLLRHLSVWWRTTGLVERVFYFGYDEHAWTRQQILVEIAQQLFDPVDYTRDFQPLSVDAQQALLTKRVGTEHYLLILDNLESITGANLSTLHTLDKSEQEALQGFLSDLAGGQTLVLFGSRRSEDWLAKGTFADNIYELPGLDSEAASTLANLILEQHDATKYREDGDFLRLLTLLDGFPLAMEVVLSNLAHQTPKEVLAALQAGDVNLDTGDPEDKTKSMLRCIDYSYGNLSPEAQQLLLCLAPYTSVFDLRLLEILIAHLKHQPSLAELPFDHFVEVLQEAVKWGLLSPDSGNSPILRLQPVLSYYLRNKLNEPGQTVTKVAIETAFREHYREVSRSLNGLLTSKDSQEQQFGQSIANLEYENLVMALHLAMAAQESIGGLYKTLINYLGDTRNHQRGLKLFSAIRERFAAYSADKLAGPLGVEYATVIGVIATWQLRLKQLEEAEQSYQQVLEVADRLNLIDEETKWKSTLKAQTYHQLGMAVQERRQWAQAERYYQQALQIYVEYNDRFAQAGPYHNLGILTQEQRQWAQAEQYYQQALQIYVEYNDRLAQALVYNQLGRAAQEQQQWAQAERYYQQALQIYVEYNDRFAQVRPYHNLGAVAQEQRQWAQAERYYQLALQIYVEYDDRHAQAGIYHNLGAVAQEQRQWAQAKQYYQQALQIYVEYDDRYNQARTYGHLGLLIQEQQPTQARDYLLKALEFYIAFQDTFYSQVVLLYLARLWKASGDADLPRLVAEKIGMTRSEVEELLRQAVLATEDIRS